MSTPHLVITLASHVATGVLLSPLDLVRTRLIVQSSHTSHRTYSGPLDAFGSILVHEGGFSAMYFHPTLFIPTLLDNTIRPLVVLSTPVFLYRSLGIAEDTHPVTFALSEFVFSSASLLVTLPIETVRRRMQVQTRNGAPPIRGCVETREKPYYGFIDALWNILTEERSTPPPRRRRRKSKGKERADDAGKEKEEDKDGRLASMGIAQLYRGLGMGLTANLVVFVLGAFAGASGEDYSGQSGWTEL